MKTWLDYDGKSETSLHIDTLKETDYLHLFDYTQEKQSKLWCVPLHSNRT